MENSLTNIPHSCPLINYHAPKRYNQAPAVSLPQHTRASSYSPLYRTAALFLIAPSLPPSISLPLLLLPSLPSLNMRTPERFFPCFESARDISMVAGSRVTKGLSRDQEERPTSICRKAQPQLPGDKRLREGKGLPDDGAPLTVHKGIRE